jgi:two-component system KDP operon response regulator KdpE
MPKKILLADDDPGVRETLGRVLESENYLVTLAGTAADANAQFLADLPDLVLLDLNLPDRDGWDVFGLMRRTHPWVPVIVITAMSHQYKRAAEHGVAALMEKPLNLPLLLVTMTELLAGRGTRPSHPITDHPFKTLYLENQP